MYPGAGEYLGIETTGFITTGFFFSLRFLGGSGGGRAMLPPYMLRQLATIIEVMLLDPILAKLHVEIISLSFAFSGHYTVPMTYHWPEELRP